MKFNLFLQELEGNRKEIHKIKTTILKHCTLEGDDKEKFVDLCNKVSDSYSKIRTHLMNLSYPSQKHTPHNVEKNPDPYSYLRSKSDETIRIEMYAKVSDMVDHAYDYRRSKDYMNIVDHSDNFKVNIDDKYIELCDQLFTGLVESCDIINDI